MLPTYNSADHLESWQYGSPRLRQKGLNPYQRLPEQDSWDEYQVRATVDGTRYLATRWASRWAGQFAQGPWRVVRVLDANEYTDREGLTALGWYFNK